MNTRQKLVEEFERRTGFQLPDDYRRFLLAGPVPVWNEEELPENPHTHLLHSFFDLSADEDRDLAVHFQTRDARLPRWFLPIGELYGVLIGLGINGPHRDRVYQWSWDDGEERELAPTFDSFLTQHRDDEAKWNAHGRGSK